MMRALRTKAVVHESGPEGALVYRKPSCRCVEPRRDRWRRWNLALPHGAGVRRRDGAVGHALCTCAASQRGRACARKRRTRHPYARAGRGLRLSRSIHPRVPRPFRGHARSGPRIDVSRSHQASGADPHGFNPHRQSSSPAFSDRQAAARRRYWRALHLRDQRGDSRPVAAFSSIRCELSRPDRAGGLRRLLQRR